MVSCGNEIIDEPFAAFPADGQRHDGSRVGHGVANGQDADGLGETKRAFRLRFGDTVRIERDVHLDDGRKFCLIRFSRINASLCLSNPAISQMIPERWLGARSKLHVLTPLSVRLTLFLRMGDAWCSEGARVKSTAPAADTDKGEVGGNPFFSQ